jgi:DNA polymerase-3 subunit alpha
MKGRPAGVYYMSVRNERPFAHLRVHSTYSLGVGLSSPTEICRHARRAGYDAITLTDIHGTYGFIEFHRAARECGIRPIYGVHIPVAPPVEGYAPLTLLLLATSDTGLRNLCALTSEAAHARDEGCAMRLDDVARRSAGMVAIAGSWPEREHLPRGTDEWLRSAHEIFESSLYAELRVGHDQLRGERFAGIAAQMGIAPVLTQDVRYVGPEKHQLLDLLSSAGDPGYEHRVHSEALGDAEGRGHGIRTMQEMSAWYELAPDAFDNASTIAALVERDLLGVIEHSNGGSATSPDFPARLRTRTYAALAGRYGKDVPVGLLERVEGELERIDAAGLAGTFVRFHDIAVALRGAGVLLGPASGLRLQSLCAFALGITSFDPYERDPAFAPAFDVAGRDADTYDLQVPLASNEAVLDVLRTLFDGEGVGYVPSVEHITPSRALRMVGERLGIPREDFEELLKIASGNHGMSLRELAQDNYKVGKLSRNSSTIRNLISHAASIEGLPYGFVRTRRSVVVSPVPLRDFLGTSNGSGSEAFVQATRDAFPLGLVRRVDISPLTALSIVDDLDPEAAGGHWAPQAVPEAYERIELGDLDGIYLLESPFTGRQARRFGIAGFDALVAFLALMRYRRGDVSFPTRVSAYRDRSGPHAGKPHSNDSTLHTNGWLLFQDQLRDVVTSLTGAVREDAERLLERFRTHGPADLAGLRQEFMRTCSENGTSQEEATEWFGRFLRLSRRAIIREPVLAEAMLIDRMLHLKYTQRVWFFAAALNHTTDATRRQVYLQAVERDGRLLAPDVGRSTMQFTMESGNIRMPMHMAAGVLRETAALIVEARGIKRFESWDEFNCVLVNLDINLEEVEALARAGALESVGISTLEDLPSHGGMSVSNSRGQRDGTDQLTLGLPAGEEEEEATGDPSTEPTRKAG